MGRSDPVISRFYKNYIRPEGDTALLGYMNNDWFEGDLYDRQLNNWDINSDWQLNKKYDSIVSTRCAYFAKDPEQFVRKCYEHLNDAGTLYVDWGLGDHWRFENYKIGWIKDGEQEYAYGPKNYLWSTVWDDSFLRNGQFSIFSHRVKRFGYEDVKEAIYREVPNVLELDSINRYFEISYNMLALWDDSPQLYILIQGKKNQ